MSATVKNMTSQTELLIDDAEMTADELSEREGRIERAQRNAYYEIGLELKAIRDGRGYKALREHPVADKYSFTTWEEYVKGRWDMAKQHADRLIGSAEAVAKLEPIGSILPARESHIRELLKLQTDDERAEVWQTVVDSGQTINAKLIEAEVERHNARKEKNWLTIEEWGELSDETRQSEFDAPSDKKFNKQDGDSIEWAQWSWNPITGCKRDCPYCYARDIANRFYTQKFEPSIYPCRFP